MKMQQENFSGTLVLARTHGATSQMMIISEGKKYSQSGWEELS
jgi:hypothetical protein